MARCIDCQRECDCTDPKGRGHAEIQRKRSAALYRGAEIHGARQLTYMSVENTIVSILIRKGDGDEKNEESKKDDDLLG